MIAQHPTDHVEEVGAKMSGELTVFDVADTPSLIDTIEEGLDIVTH